MTSAEMNVVAKLIEASWARNATLVKVLLLRLQLPAILDRLSPREEGKR